MVIMKKLVLALTLSIVTFGTTVAQQYSFSVGDSYTLTTENDQLINQMMMGQEMEITNNIISSEMYEITALEGDVYTIKVTTLSNKTTISSPQGTQTMSSDGTSPADLSMKALTGVEYSFTMNNTGEILDVTGLEEAQAYVKKQVEGTPLAQAAAQLTAAFTKDELMSNLDRKFSIYPDEPSNEWTIKKDLNLNNMPVSVSADYTLSGNEIKMDGTLTISGKGVFNGMQLDMDMSGTQKGTYLVDSESGAILSSNSVNDMNGTVGAQGMTIPMFISTTTKTTLEKN